MAPRDNPPRDNPYVTLRLQPEAADEIRRLARQLSAAADRDVTQSEAVIAAARYALEHLPDVAARLPGPPPREGRPG